MSASLLTMHLKNAQPPTKKQLERLGNKKLNSFSLAFSLSFLSIYFQLVFSFFFPANLPLSLFLVSFSFLFPPLFYSRSLFAFKKNLVVCLFSLTFQYEHARKNTFTKMEKDRETSLSNEKKWINCKF